MFYNTSYQGVEVILYDRAERNQLNRGTFPVSGIGGPEQVESLARTAWRDYDNIIHIPAMDYRRDPHEIEVRNMATINSDDPMRDIRPEMTALWCEVTEHPFSAKDPDKVVLSFRGEARLSCGPCAQSFFQANQGETEKKAVTE